MKSITFILVLFCSYSLMAQELTAEEFQAHLNEEFKNPEESPLSQEDLVLFEALPFFEINEEFRFNARLELTEKAKSFKMKTSTDRMPEYRKFGILHFEYRGKEYHLAVYQNLKLMEIEEYVDYLFLPFTDLSNGDDTYGGGRFIDLRIPQSEEMELDFNKAYNPLCAYNHGYSCPIPPKENHLDIRIEAGVKYISSEHE